MEKILFEAAEYAVNTATDPVTLERVAIGIGSLFLSICFQLFIAWVRKPAAPLSELAQHLLALLDKASLWELEPESSGGVRDSYIVMKKLENGSLHTYEPRFSIITTWPLCFHGGHSVSEELSSREKRLVKRRANEVYNILLKKRERQLERESKSRTNEVIAKLRSIRGVDDV